MNGNVKIASLALLAVAVAVPVVYVSNTWNHMMDTLDTNRSLSKVRVP